MEPYLHSRICLNGIYRNNYTFLSFVHLTVLAFPLIKLLQFVHNVYMIRLELQNLQCLIYNFKDNQYCWLCCLERILWRLQQTCKQMLLTFSSLNTGWPDCPLKFVLSEPLKCFINQNMANLPTGESQHSCS